VSAPILTPFTDAAPCPRVEVFFEDFTPGTSHVTVYRLAGGREFQMRGAVMAPTGGTLTRIDFEVPFNIPVTYRAEQFDAAGLSLGFTATSALTVSASETWMHNPLNPQGSVRVFFGDDGRWSVTRPTPGVVSRPLGRRVGVVLSEPRQGVTGLRLTMRTSTDADADKVQAMVGDDGMPPVLCVRLGLGDSRLRVPQPLFLSALSVAEVDLDHRWGGTELAHEVGGDEVDPPIPGLFIPLLTRADINAFFSTRSAVNAGGLTRADINRRYDLAGTAS
jgi:hypothetical protein